MPREPNEPIVATPVAAKRERLMSDGGAAFAIEARGRQRIALSTGASLVSCVFFLDTSKESATTPPVVSTRVITQ